MTDDAPQRTVADLLFVGLNGRIVALDRYSGEIVWRWKTTRTAGYVTMLLDGDRLMVSCKGYLWCLDPLFGQEVWHNPLKGFGTSIASMTSAAGGAADAGAAATLAQQQQAAATAAATGGAAG